MTKHAHDTKLAEVLRSKHENEGVQYKAMASESGVNTTTISRFARGLQGLTSGSYKKLRNYVKAKWDIELPAGGGGDWPWCESCRSYHSPDPSLRTALGCKADLEDLISPRQVVVTFVCDWVDFRTSPPTMVNSRMTGIEPA